MRHERTVLPSVVPVVPSPRGGTQTRMQATFEAIKKMSGGLSSSPRIDFSPRKSGGSKEEGKQEGSGTEGEEGFGYFDVVPEVVDA